MIVSSGFLATIVILALAVTITALVMLVIIWIMDWKKGQLW